MINEELTDKSINIEMRMAKATSHEILKQLRILYQEAKKQGISLSQHLNHQVKSNSIPLEQLAKKGQLETIPLHQKDLKELKKELNRYGVNFSIVKNTDNEKGFSVFFQARDTVILDKAFKDVLVKQEKKAVKKTSTLANIKKFKEKANELAKKIKEKTRGHEL